MPRSLADIAAAVQAEQAILEQIGGGVDPFGGEITIPDGGVGFQRQYVGELKDVDEIVIAIGDPDEIAMDNAPYPLTDIYRFLQGLAAQMDGQPGVLTVQVTWGPPVDPEGAFEEFE